MAEIPDKYFPIFFLSMWVVVSFVLSIISGWSRLAEDYKITESRRGKKFWFQSAQFRNFTSYGNCLTFSVSPEGFGLSVLLPFRIGHPPLFFPWSKIALSEKRKLFWHTIEFNISGMKFSLSKSAAKKVEEAAGASWPKIT